MFDDRNLFLGHVARRIVLYIIAFFVSYGSCYGLEGTEIW